MIVLVTESRSESDSGRGSPSCRPQHNLRRLTHRLVHRCSVDDHDRDGRSWPSRSDRHPFRVKLAGPRARAPSCPECPQTDRRRVRRSECKATASVLSIRGPRGIRRRHWGAGPARRCAASPGWRYRDESGWQPAAAMVKIFILS
jgi:hypothetical protein